MCPSMISPVWRRHANTSCIQCSLSALCYCASHPPSLPRAVAYTGTSCRQRQEAEEEGQVTSYISMSCPVRTASVTPGPPQHLLTSPRCCTTHPSFDAVDPQATALVTHTGVVSHSHVALLQQRQQPLSRGSSEQRTSKHEDNDQRRVAYPASAPRLDSTHFVRKEDPRILWTLSC